MKPANNDRAVVVLGPVSAQLATTLHALGLSAFDDESGDATLWLPSHRAVRVVADPVIGARMSSPSEKGPLLLTIVQAAAALSVGRSTLYEMIARGELDVVRLGRAVRVPVRAVEELVDGLRGRTVAS
jgi:excisionase family DNA binding protein